MNGARRQAREAALQILYFCEVGHAQPPAAIETFFSVHQPEAPSAIREFAGQIVHGTVAETPALDAIIQEHAHHWRVERLAVVDRLILRMAIWELRHASETPPAVILNEALELARRFSSEDAVRFVNGILDAVHQAGKV